MCGTFAATLGANLLMSKMSQAPEVLPPSQVVGRYSTSQFRRGTGRRGSRAGRTIAAPVETTASYSPESRYKAVVQAMLRDNTVKQAKAKKA